MTSNQLPIGRGLRIIFIAVGILTAIVGLALYLFPARAGVDSGQWWPWPLRTTLTTQFFGALFTGVGVGAFWAARQKTWQQVRGLFPPGLTFTALATLAAFMNNDSFYYSSTAMTWFFFGLYIAVLVGGLAVYVYYERRR